MTNELTLLRTRYTHLNITFRHPKGLRLSHGRRCQSAGLEYHRRHPNGEIVSKQLVNLRKRPADGGIRDNRPTRSHTSLDTRLAPHRIRTPSVELRQSQLSPKAPPDRPRLR